MDGIRDRARLADAAAFGGRGVTATVPRSEIEDVLRSEDGSPELVLDIERRDDGEVEAHTLRLEWDSDELEELLRQDKGEEVTLMFDSAELEGVLENFDVEAHGLRERAVVLAVAAAAAAGASQASAMPFFADGGGGAATPVEMISDAASSGPVAPAVAPQLISDAASTGPVSVEAAASPELVSDAASSGPSTLAAADESQAAARTASGGGGVEISAPDPATTSAIIGGAALAISAAFAMRRRRPGAGRPA